LSNAYAVTKTVSDNIAWSGGNVIVRTGGVESGSSGIWKIGPSQLKKRIEKTRAIYFKIFI
jgi:hypothetical protein